MIGQGMLFHHAMPCSISGSAAAGKAKAPVSLEAELRQAVEQGDQYEVAWLIAAGADPEATANVRLFMWPAGCMVVWYSNQACRSGAK